MVLESLFNPFVLKKRPWEMFFAGFLYSVVGLLISYLVFREVAGILTVFLIVMAAIPVVYAAIKYEEELDIKPVREWVLLKEHTKVLLYLMAFFMGVTAALVLLYVFLPQTMVEQVFTLQNQAIVRVNSDIQSQITGGITRFDILVRILVNNLKVLFFCLVFSFLYGTGAIFILTWNASVIAAAMGGLAKLELGKAAALAGLPEISSYFSVAAFSFFRYMTHGVFEIAAYFVAGLAGGIISIALIKHELKEDKVLIDALDLVLISLGVLIVAGIIEVYVTPALFS